MKKYEESAEARSNIEGWICKHCRRFFGADEHAARWCCSDDQPCECGGRKTQHRNWCDKCSAEKSAEREKKKLDNAELVEYNGVFVIDERIYRDTDEYLDDCECDEAEPVEYAYVPNVVRIVNLDTYRIIEDATEDGAYEEWDISGLEGMKELEKSIKEFNEINKGELCYHEGSKQKFRIRKESP